MRRPPRPPTGAAMSQATAGAAPAIGGGHPRALGADLQSGATAAPQAAAGDRAAAPACRAASAARSATAIGDERPVPQGSPSGSVAGVLACGAGSLRADPPASSTAQAILSLRRRLGRPVNVDVGALFGVAGTIYGAWAEWRAKKHKRELRKAKAEAKAEAERTAADLARILEEAHKQ
jgi:hypothetical protein